MEKQTLQFNSLSFLAAFTKSISTGYLMNTNKLTLTGCFLPEQVDAATGSFGALLVETTEHVYTY